MNTSRPPSAALPVVVVGALLALLVLAGCARDSQDWKSAQDADTQESYEAFLARHPASEFAPQAKQRVDQLGEERDWATATQSDTPEAYGKFVGQHPDGKWTQEARIRIENFNVMAAAAPETPAPAAAVPAPPPAPDAARPASVAAKSPVAAAQPAAAPAGGVGHRVQLGAFSSQAKAESEWARVSGRFAALQGLEPQVTAVQTAAGRLFRLQAAQPDEAGAKSLCEQLKAGGQPCLYVPPK